MPPWFHRQQAYAKHRAIWYGAIFSVGTGLLFYFAAAKFIEGDIHKSFTNHARTAQNTINARIKSYFAPNFFRPSHADKLLKEAHSKVSEAKMKRAVNAVAHGEVTVHKAAEDYGVKVEDLRNTVSGTKRKGRGTDIGEIKAEISNRNKGNSNRTVAIFRDLLDKFQDGEISDKKVAEVLDHVERLNRQASLRIRPWRERLEAMKGKAKAKS